MRDVLFIVCAILVCASCSQPQKQSPPSVTLGRGSLRSSLEKAKRDGLTSAVLLSTVHDSEEFKWTLDQILDKYSALVVKPTGKTAMDVQPDVFYKWHVLAVERDLSVRPPDVEVCKWAMPPTLSVTQGEVGLPLQQGMITVDGITLTATHPHSNISLDRTRRYLLLVVKCSEQLVVNRLYVSGVYRLGESGQIMPNLAGPTPQFAQELSTLNIKELEGRLRGHQSTTVNQASK